MSPPNTHPKCNKQINIDNQFPNPLFPSFLLITFFLATMIDLILLFLQIFIVPSVLGSRHFRDFVDANPDAYKSYDFRCESVRRDKFLAFAPADAGFANCVGIGHIRLALSCLLNDAVHMRRVALVPSVLCANLEHNGGVTIPPQPLTKYWRFDEMPCTEEFSKFLEARNVTDAAGFDYADPRALKQLESVRNLHMKSDNRSATENGVRHSTLTLSTHEDFIDADLVVRSHFGWRHWWSACEGATKMYWLRVSTEVRAVYIDAARAVADAIGMPFALAFVRRGDKVKLFPELDRATSAENIAAHIAACVPLDKYAVYIATDEFHPDYFAPTRRALPQLRLFMARDFVTILRSFLEPNVTKHEYDVATRQRAQFLHASLRGETDARVRGEFEPVLLDNNALFVFETQLTQLASAQFCTQPERCPNYQPTTLHDNDNENRRCSWKLTQQL
jgi:hypothetical protein